MTTITAGRPDLLSYENQDLHHADQYLGLAKLDKTLNTIVSEDYLTIKTTDYGGRGYFANLPIRRGTVVLRSSEPFSCVVFKPFKKEVCAYCFSYDNGKSRKVQVEGKTKPNSGAYAGVYFCTTRCRDQWKCQVDSTGNLSSALHRFDRFKPSGYPKGPEPTTIQRIIDMYRPQFNPENSMALQEKLDAIWNNVHASRDSIDLEPLDDTEYDNCRLLIHALIGSIEMRPQTEDFINLQSNEIPHLCQFPFLLESHIKVYVYLRRVLCKSMFPDSLFNVKFVRQTLGKEAGNAFGIWELPMMSESECFGTAIHPAASYFNHECEPNVSKHREGRAMVFTANRDIAAGEQLFISYGMMDELPFTERQKLLEDQWFFICQCTRCKQESMKSNL